ncbi:nudix-type nucleoside diphosphatase (YffH/AdpP family) [Gelidibacter algens]|uniref:GDP-mannose pyrophosphatase n=1 Tax=Gelidibacter algens TaxID=49280 RepID=A0A1A7R023_9FLAO|nr:NUDIX domain-containing protein [Gelidibacter algens]OBX24878.1 NUDIX domain-containing protein [Gelidibacter algens]RAJ27542.1 nudix-type nucleoside diphosphatase (YffH/AdpP family) [Gelidibacter algens]
MSNKIKNITHRVLSKAWATLLEINYDFQFKNGTWKRVSRESYDRGHGCGILLYNIDKGTVILTKQFRMPIYHTNEEEGMSIEVCAGAIDKIETPESTIIREVEEEVGYKIKEVKQVMEAYTSPGALTEKMYLFVARYSDAMKVNEGGGVFSEHEEIEVIELPLSRAIQMVSTGEIKDAKTIMLLQYAQINNLV